MTVLTDFTRLTDLPDEDLLKFLALLESIHANDLQVTLEKVRRELEERTSVQSA